MARTTSANFTGGLDFSLATSGPDLFKKEDVEILAQAVDQHDHSTGKGLPMPAGSITSAMIADGTIVAGDLANGAVTSGKIQSAVHLTAPVVDSGGLAVTGNSTNTGSFWLVGTAAIAPAATSSPISTTSLLVYGPGNTSADNAILVRNSSSVSLFMVRDDGLTTMAGPVTITNNSAQALAIGTTPALTQLLCLPNNQGIGWRNGANSGDVTLTCDSTNRLAFTNFATGGVPGAATGSLTVLVNGVARSIAYT